MNTDYVKRDSGQNSDAINLLSNPSAGREFLTKHTDVKQMCLDGLADLDLSSIANVIGAIKLAKYIYLDGNGALLTVATDGTEMHRTKHTKVLLEHPKKDFDEFLAAEISGRYILGAETDHL